MPYKITDKVYNLCTSSSTVSDELARDPSLAPGKAAERLFRSEAVRVLEKKPPKDRIPATADDLKRAYECGRFGETRPSELFLRVFHDALCTLEHDPLMGVVSPPLMGSTGVLPLTVIGPLPDLLRHMANLIVRAEKEVLIGTNYWMDSDASHLITNALRELNQRAGERGQRVVCKMIYDRGNIKQLADHHHIDSVKEYMGKGIAIPGPDEIPNIDMQVQNYHRPALGTFHAKYAIFDRKYGVIQSSNIQDNANLEMLTHVEGPIVDSLYDTFLISWHKEMEPPSSTLNQPAEADAPPTFQKPSFHTLFSECEKNGGMPNGAVSETRMPENLCTAPVYDLDMAGEVLRKRSVMSATTTESAMQVVTRHLNNTTHQMRNATAPECAPVDAMQPYIPHRPHAPCPMALVSRKPWGAPNHSCVYTPQNEAWLSAVRNAQSHVFIQTPDLNAEPLLPEIAAAVRRGVVVEYYVCLGYNDAGELLPGQGGTNEMVANKLYEELGDDEESRSRLKVHYYVAKDQVMPVHDKFKGRSCHIKLMIVDRHLGIQGNGNQDAQSWFHSQEVNLMIDSEEVCRDWLEALRRNQNTHLYGKADQKDGLWYDEDGKEAPGAIGKNPGHFAWATGIMGAIDRVRGVGGF
ncbi:hypothetical protein K402DRAFT_322349 [Aulographum hederae CBS 113979]|uniref:PLD phosphodiesterase domain-containing protein n=1 Tax=Aulographum hederae CBS 113979 TaxID=1176131 RepID=A0A6G1HDZ1_9PEZI|nr:hypothetical protein K402DRAFT_322349 [Aulographum hederae CBS 113979]